VQDEPLPEAVLGMILRFCRLDSGGESRCRFVKIAGFQADVKKMPVNVVFPDMLVSVTLFDKPDLVAAVCFINNVQIFRPAGPAFDAIPFHVSIIGKSAFRLSFFAYLSNPVL
jgi:hypothetical protein